ncbi:MAG: hypothetical protein M0Q93_04255 [Terrimicrobiaceae bacterium]|nr:hypothetical protein [Terrimicrobiaceae bacterium]
MKVATPDFERSHRYLAEFLDPLTSVLGRSERRVGALRYLQGLLLPGGSANPLNPWRKGLGWTPRGCSSLLPTALGMTRPCGGRSDAR